jgi:hypothetical protein
MGRIAVEKFLLFSAAFWVQVVRPIAVISNFKSNRGNKLSVVVRYEVR